MIDHLTGTVATVGPTWVVMDLAGFGLRALCTPATAATARPGERITLQTSLVVREDALTLYGFADASERELFEMVQSVTGFGAKLALAVGAVLSPDELRAAVQAENLAALTRVPGIGRKGAQRLVLELKDKVASLGTGTDAVVTPAAQQADGWREQVTEGLVGLGWSAKDAEAACDNVAELAGSEPAPSLGELMRAALASLARR